MGYYSITVLIQVLPVLLDTLHRCARAASRGSIKAPAPEDAAFRTKATSEQHKMETRRLVSMPQAAEPKARLSCAKAELEARHLQCEARREVVGSHNMCPKA